MAGKVCVVTGGSSGIGKETAAGLASLGAEVVIVARDRNRIEAAKKELIGRTGNNNVVVQAVDLSLMGPTRDFVKQFVSSHSRLDVLVNNAGGVFSRRRVTSDGFENTLALNYLSPFVLTRGLVPLMASLGQARVVNVGSAEHSRASLDFGDLQMSNRWRSRRAYMTSKLMLTMFTYELARRVGGKGITANVVQPGFVATNLGKNSGSRVLSAAFRFVRPFQISAQTAAETPVWMAASDEVMGSTGKCYAKLREVSTSPDSYDAEAQTKLWDTTSALLGLPQDLEL